MVEIVKNIDDTTTKDIEEMESKLETMNRIYLIVILGVFVAAVIFSMSMALQATKNITGITAKIMDAVTALSKGDLKAHMDYKGDNEFGELA